MKTRTMVLLSFLAITLMAYVVFMYKPTPITDLEKAEIAKQIEWSGNGDTMTGRLPVIKIPGFRLVRVFSYGTKNGYRFQGEHLAVELGGSIDVAEIARNIKRTN